MTPRAASQALPFALVLAIAALPAWAKTSDRNQPMDIAAADLDCSTDETRPCIYSGNVHVLQGSLDIRATRAEIRQGGGDIQRVVLTGSPVTMKQELDDGGRINARAARVDYDMPKDTVVFTGDVELDQPGRGTMRGARIVYNMATGQVQGGGGRDGQIRTRILPKGAQQPPAAAPRGGG